MISRIKFNKKLRILTAIVSIIVISIINIAPDSAVADSETPTQEKAGAPDKRRSAGSRSDCINANNRIKELTSLMPTKDNIGSTLSASPTLFVYVPQTNNKRGNFIVREGNKILSSTVVKLPSKAGIVSLTIPDNSNVSGLEMGKNYQWTFAIVCNEQNRFQDEYLSGYVQRIDNPELEKKIQLNPIDKRVNFYAQEGIWQETLTTLVQLRQDNPNNYTFVENWQNLLKSVGLENVATQPLIEP